MDIYEHFNIEKPMSYYYDSRYSWVDRLEYDLYNFLYGEGKWNPILLKGGDDG